MLASLSDHHCSQYTGLRADHRPLKSDGNEFDYCDTAVLEGLNVCKRAVHHPCGWTRESRPSVPLEHCSEAEGQNVARLNVLPTCAIAVARIVKVRVSTGFARQT